MKKNLDTLVRALERNFHENFDVYDDGAYLNPKELKIGNDIVWIEDYDIDRNEFVICIDRNNGLEYPNIENYLAEELSKRINIADEAYNIEEENKREEEAIYETNLSLCRSFGWSTSFSN